MPLIGETVIRLRGVPGPDGDIDWTDPSEVPIAGCKVAPSYRAGSSASSEDNRDSRRAVFEGLTVFTPPAADVTSADRLVVRDRTYEVVGEPRTWQLGRRVTLTRLTG